MSLDINKIRADFPQLGQKVYDQDLVYFDNAATTLKPRPVIEALTNHYSKEVSNVHRGIHYFSEAGTILFEKTRLAIKDHLNASSEVEIIFTKGTTDAINLVASSYGELLASGDEVLISTMEHHSNIVPWQIMAEKKGVIVREIPIDDNGDILIEEYQKLLQGNVKLVAITHVSNTLGTINPVKELIKMAHDAGAKILIDGAQAAPHMKVNVQDLDCDFYTLSGHKVYGPTGIGVLYGKRELLDKMPPYQGGGAMIKEVSFSGTTFNDLPEKFEAGTPHIAGVIALKTAFDYINDLGLDSIAAYEDELLQYATEKINALEDIRIIGTAKKKAAVISLEMVGIHPQDIGTLLNRQGIAVRTGHHCTQPLMKRFNVPATTRASFSFYNTKHEIDLFINGLIKTREFF